MFTYPIKSEKECNEMRLIPKGDYDFEVAKVEQAQSKKGDPMIKVSLKVFTETGGVRMFTDFILLTENWAWKFRHLCVSVGLEKEYEAGKVTPDVLEGRPGWLKMGTSKRKDTGEEQNSVIDYTFETPVEKPAAPVERKPDDDVPF